MDTYETGGGAAVAQAASRRARQPRLQRRNRALGLVHPQSGPEEQAAVHAGSRAGRRGHRAHHQPGDPKADADRIRPEWFDPASDETPEGSNAAAGGRESQQSVSASRVSRCRQALERIRRPDYLRARTSLSMANVVLKHLDKNVSQRLSRRSRCQSGNRRRRVHRARRPQRLRQVDDAADGRRPGRTTGGEIWIGDRLRERRRRPATATSRWCFRTTRSIRTCRVCQNMAFGLKMRRTPKAEIEKRVREAAAHSVDRRRCSIAGRASFPAASGNASRSAGRSFANRKCFCSMSRYRISTPSCDADAGRNRAAAPAAEDDDHLRHARPGRSDDARRPHRADRLRRHSNPRHAAESVTEVQWRRCGLDHSLVGSYSCASSSINFSSRS